MRIQKRENKIIICIELNAASLLGEWRWRWWGWWWWWWRYDVVERWWWWWRWLLIILSNYSYTHTVYLTMHRQLRMCRILTTLNFIYMYIYMLKWTRCLLQLLLHGYKSKVKIQKGSRTHTNTRTHTNIYICMHRNTQEFICNNFVCCYCWSYNHQLIITHFLSMLACSLHSLSFISHFISSLIFRRLRNEAIATSLTRCWRLEVPLKKSRLSISTIRVTLLKEKKKNKRRA